GLNPVRGQNDVQGGGDMGAIPDRFPGFQSVEVDAVRQMFERSWGVTLPPRKGRHLTAMMQAMDDGQMTSCYIVGENPVQSDADSHEVRRRLLGLDHLVVQDIFLTPTAELA